jgi:leucyl-tRNA synthetase
VADPEVAREDELELAVQLDGKVRGHITVPPAMLEDEIKARALDSIKHLLDGKQVASIRVVPGRLVSVVTR